MNAILPRMRRGGWSLGLAAALGMGMVFAAVAQPIPVPAPRATTSLPSSGPFGGLLARQALAIRQAAAPLVIGLKLGESGGRSRFIIELSDPVDVRVFTLTSPNRVVIDMPELMWRIPSDVRPSGKGAVKSYRYGLFRKGNSRFIVDLNTPVKVAMPQLLQPEGDQSFRLVIDLTPSTQPEFLANAGWPKEEPGAIAEPRAAVPPVSARGGRRVIVVDAGHGGIDPGTHGQSGLLEKNLVLAVAKELRRSLEASGKYRVQLTRDSDVFIPLRERVNIARAAQGDLFVSLHADSNDHRDIRGASVYTLSEDASDREAGILAEKENMSDAIAGVDLAGENNPVASILIDLTQRGTMNRSARFAETVIGALPVATPLLPAFPHRSAGFAVLKAPDVPAVLIELGYLTNPKDESEMATQAWRSRVAHAVALAIDAHFSAETGFGPRTASRP